MGHNKIGVVDKTEGASPVEVVDFLAAYGFTCSSIENFCRCCCPHHRHVPRIIYLIALVIVLVGLLVTLVVGLACQVRKITSYPQYERHSCPLACGRALH